jgi:hypothetical protein
VYGMTGRRLSLTGLVCKRNLAAPAMFVFPKHIHANESNSPRIEPNDASDKSLQAAEN